MRLSITNEQANRTFEYALTFSDHLSQPVPIAGTALTLSVSDDVTPGMSWRVENLARPADDLGTIAARLAGLGPDVFLKLWGPSPAEPFLSWKAVWESESPLPDRIAAVVLAVAARTSEARLNPGA